MIALRSSTFRPMSQRRKKFDGVPREVVEIETFQFEGCLFQEAAHPPDDFGGALVIM